MKHACFVYVEIEIDMITTMSEQTPELLIKSDLELLRLYFEAGLHDAFTELVRRFQHSAYRMAFTRTGNRAQAEEAVQEAFLVMAGLPGRRAQKHNSDLRFWFLGVVSNVAKNASRSERRAIRRADAARSKTLTVSKAEESEVATVGIVDSETRELLEKAIGGLNEKYRLPLILHYVENLNQREIARLMGVNQSSVARQLDEALNQLRLVLNNTGVACGVVALPVLLKAPNLLEAPARLQQALMHPNFLDAAAYSESIRAAASAGKATASLKVAAWVLIVLVAAGGAYAWKNAQGQGTGPVHFAQQPERATVVPSLAPVHVAFSRTWDFNTREQADDFQVLEGSWHHIPDGGPDGKGCMESDGDFFVAIPVPLGVSSAKLPIRITYRERVALPGTSTEWMSTFAWSDSDYRWKANFHNLGKIILVDPTGPVWKEIRTYIGDSFMASWTNEELQLFSAFGLKGNGKQGLAMCMLGRHRICDLTIQEIATAELPNVRSYLAALEKIEPSKRVGRVIVPELQSHHPPDPVFIVFDDLTKVPEARTSRP